MIPTSTLIDYIFLILVINNDNSCNTLYAKHPYCRLIVPKNVANTKSISSTTHKCSFWKTCYYLYPYICILLLLSSYCSLEGKFFLSNGRKTRNQLVTNSSRQKRRKREEFFCTKYSIQFKTSNLVSSSKNKKKEERKGDKCLISQCEKKEGEKEREKVECGK